MSEIYIPGMKMPANCHDCNCFIRDSDGSDYCCLLMRDIEDNYKRDDDCPLVHVQKHWDLIDRDALSKSLDRLCDRVCQYSKAQRKVMCGACPLGDAFAVVEDDAPTIIPADKVAPVRHGRWTKTIGENGVTSACRCNLCGFEDNRYSLFNYCPNCGAKMDGEA